MPKYGVNTLFQSDDPNNTIPSGGAGYNTQARSDFIRSWIDDAASLGAEVIRYPGDWIGLEGAGSQQYSAAYVQETVDGIAYARSQGMDVIFEFGQTPQWAKPAGVDEGNFTPPANPQDYANAAGYLQRQFVEFGVADAISGWEIWNEPNADLGWPTGGYRNPLPQNQGIDPSKDFQSAVEYTQLLNAAYNTLKGVDPDVTVLGGSLAGADFEYLSWMMQNGAQFDGLAVHPYTRNYDNPNFNANLDTSPARPTDDPTRFQEGQGLSNTLNERFSFEYGLNELRSILDANGRQDADFYITEFGWDVDPTPGRLAVDTFEQQAEYILSGLEVLRDRGDVEAVTVFQLYDFLDGDFGLLDDNGNFRPGGGVFADFVATFGGDVNDNSGSTIYGTTGDDDLSGTAEDDLIIADAGIDIIAGSAGNDTIVGDPAGDSPQEYDQVSYFDTGAFRSDFTFTLNPDGSVTSASNAYGTDVWFGIDGVYFGGDDSAFAIETLTDSEVVEPENPDTTTTNTINGTTGNDRPIVGTSANDLIIADAGSDIINASTGNDTIVGDPQDGPSAYDQVDYFGDGSFSENFVFTQNENGSVTAFSPDFGTDTLFGIEGVWFGDEGAWYELNELAQPAQNDGTPSTNTETSNTVFGSTGDDVLRGTNANDLFIADGGLDIIVGDGGNDTIVGDPEGGPNDYDQMDYYGDGSRLTDFSFTSNGDGSVTAVSGRFGTDTLFGVEGVWFGQEQQWYAIDELI